MLSPVQTERLILRDWEFGDFEPFAALYADPERAKFVGGACSRDVAWIRMLSMAGHHTIHGYGPYALERKSDAQFVGWAGAWNPIDATEPDLSYALVKDAEGRGLATEAARCALSITEDMIGEPLASFIVPENKKSIAVALRLGGELERMADIGGVSFGVFRYRGI